VCADERVLDVAAGNGNATLAAARRRYHSAGHWVQVFRDFYGPTHKAFATLNEMGRKALERDIITLLEGVNTAGAMSLVVPGEYLEVVIRKK
jgi:hypothetical protein